MLGWIRFDVHGQFYPEDNRSERLPRAWLGLFLLSGQGENQLLVTQEAPPRCISVFWEVSFHECVFFSQFCPMVQDENKVASRWCLKSTTGIDSKGQWSLSVTQGAAILSLSTLNRHYDESVGTHSRPWLKALKPFLRTILTGSANAFIFWWKNLKKKNRANCKIFTLKHDILLISGHDWCPVIAQLNQGISSSARKFGITTLPGWHPHTKEMEDYKVVIILYILPEKASAGTLWNQECAHQSTQNQQGKRRKLRYISFVSARKMSPQGQKIWK